MLVDYLQQRLATMLGIEGTVNPIRNNAQTVILPDKRNPPRLLQGNNHAQHVVFHGVFVRLIRCTPSRLTDMNKQFSVQLAQCLDGVETLEAPLQPKLRAQGILQLC
ncbi:hypothetical protein D9M71_557130 [compost metagenome]